MRDRRSRPTNAPASPIASKASDVGSGMALTPVTMVLGAGLSVPNWNCMACNGGRGVNAGNVEYEGRGSDKERVVDASDD